MIGIAPQKNKGCLGQMPQRYFPVVQITTPPVGVPFLCSLPCGSTHLLYKERFPGFERAQSEIRRSPVPNWNFHGSHVIMHATRRTQAALGAVGRYNSVAPSSSQRKWLI